MTTSRQPSEAYPRSGMCECVRFHINYLCTSYGELRFDFICHTSLSCILTVKSAENKVRKGKSTLLQGAGLYIAKIITRLEINAER